MSTAEAEDTEIVADPETDDTETLPEEPDETETDALSETDAATDDGPSLEAVNAQLRDRDKKLEKERATHEKRLSALYGDEWASHVMCPLCIGEGFLEPWQPGEIPPEQLDAMDALAGRYTPPEYITDDSYVMCEKCDGWGKNVTGSKNPEHLTKICDDCSGNGYKKKLYVPQVPNTSVSTGTGTTLGVSPSVSYGSPGPADQWGRPAGHVHYGIEPQFVTA